MVSLKGGAIPTCRCFLSILLSTNSWNPRALKLTEALNHWQSVVFSHEADINVYSIHSDAITKKNTPSRSISLKSGSKLPHYKSK
jgi:hypothetical protein